MTRGESTYASHICGTLCASYPSRGPEEGSILFVDDVLRAIDADGF